MPVKHDLFADLHLSKEDILARGKSDERLQHLLNQYQQADLNVVEAEKGLAGGIGDDELKKLKEHRLLIKDRIASRLEAAD
ncbi:hypothetical protein PS3A_45380 [Pseudomonas sp. 3A(2025)]